MGQLSGRSRLSSRVATGFGTEQRTPVNPENLGNGFRGFYGRLPSGLVLVQGPNTDPCRVCEGLKGPGVNASSSHRSSLELKSKMSRPEDQLNGLDAPSKIQSMSNDPWPQRKRFRDLVDAKVASGVSKEDQADALGLAFSTFVT